MEHNHKKFRDHVLDWYTQHKRDHLPWRTNISLYGVHVSEVMLQQTQVDRVVGFYNRWLEKFPSYIALANAPIYEVYELWKGLGYNSRAKRLWDAAQNLKGVKESEAKSLFEHHAKIPGVGPYTQAAIETFVFNKKIPFIETNIRRVYIHHFFNDAADIHDNEILKLVAETLEYIDDPRTWYWALMDYGSTLPKVLKYNPNKQSKHYTKQSKFEGSLRQLRAKILFFVSSTGVHGMTRQSIIDEFPQEGQDFIDEALAALLKDKLIQSKGDIFMVQ
ncbi:MAG TPA: A/G-specific adenine glycosylase [Candidatus Paceibacterota bacterium]